MITVFTFLYGLNIDCICILYIMFVWINIIIISVPPRDCPGGITTQVKVIIHLLYNYGSYAMPGVAPHENLKQCTVKVWLSANASPARGRGSRDSFFSFLVTWLHLEQVPNVYKVCIHITHSISRMWRGVRGWHKLEQVPKPIQSLNTYHIASHKCDCVYEAGNHM